MRNTRILLLAFFSLAGFGTIQAQSSEFEIQNIIDRFNKEVPKDPGSDYREYKVEDCIFSVTHEREGNQFIFSFSLNEIERVYKDKADMEDSYETMFFVCNNGSNCITSNDEMKYPIPVFPVRLPDYQHSTLGEDAIKVFSSVVGNCN